MPLTLATFAFAPRVGPGPTTFPRFTLRMKKVPAHELVLMDKECMDHRSAGSDN